MVGRQTERPLDQRIIAPTSSQQSKASSSNVRSADSSPTKKVVKNRAEPSRSYAAPTYSVLPSAGLMHLDGLARNAASSSESLTSSSATSMPDTATLLLGRREHDSDVITRAELSAAALPVQQRAVNKGKAATVRNSALVYVQPTSDVYRRGVPVDISDAVKYAGMMPPASGATENPTAASQLSAFPPVDLTVNSVAIPPAPSTLQSQARSENLLRANSRDTASSAVSSSRSSIAASVSSISTNGSTAVERPKQKKRKKLKPSQIPTITDYGSAATNNRLRAPEAGHGAASSFPVNRAIQRTETATDTRSRASQSRPISRSNPPSSQISATAPTVSQMQSRNASRPSSTLQAAQPTSRPSSMTSAVPVHPVSSQTRASAPGHRSAAGTSPVAVSATIGRMSPPPPAWSPPATTITLAFTPMHAYIAEIHDHAPSAAVMQTSHLPTIPDSPPPAFRSRPPSPQDIQSDNDNYIPGLSSAAISMRDRGYASSENEIDLICTQGRRAGPAANLPPSSNNEAALLWHLRHWEAWRRQGMSLEERWQRIHTASTLSTLSQSPQQSSRARASEQNSTRGHRGIVTSAASRRISALASVVTEQASIPRTAFPEALQEAVPAVAVPAQNASGNLISSQDTSALSVDVHPPKFPSVGSVRRARLKRFEAQRRDSRMLSSVMEAPNVSSGVAEATTIALPAVDLPMLAQPDAAGPSATPSSKSPTSSASAGSTADVQILPLVPAAASPAQRAGDVRTQSTTDDKPSVSEFLPTSMTSNVSQVTATLTPPRLKLAQQLAAEVALRSKRAGVLQAQNTVTAAALSQAADAGDNLAADATTLFAAAAGPISAAKVRAYVQTAPTRLARLPGQHVTAEIGHAARTVAMTQAGPNNSASSALTLPRAPPRVTTDPLSIDNLKRLSQQKLHEVDDDDDGAFDSDSSEGDDSKNSVDIGGRLSSSDSDSADGDGGSTIRKPPSSLQSSSMQYMPPTLSPTRTAYGQETAEVVAANWRRAEEGRRFSALLSRPLSIKRKPPPIPPKRWGQIWDSNTVRQRIGAPWQSNIDHSDAQSGNAPLSQPSRMPTRLHTSLIPELEEDSNWETFGESQQVRLDPNPPWETFGRNDNVSEEADSLEEAGVTQDDSDGLDTAVLSQTSPQGSNSMHKTPSSINTSPGAALRRNSALRRSSYVRQRPISPTQSRKSYSSRDSSTQHDGFEEIVPPRPRRPLPIPPHIPVSIRDENLEAEEHRQLEMAISASLRPAEPVSEVNLTDADVDLANLASAVPATPGPRSETSGQRRPATASEIDALPVGRVELERRRIDKNGKVKQKLACVGIGCNKCGICLTQFKEDELAVVLPECFHVFHASPCLRTYLGTSHVCPTCQSPLV